jgi:cell division protein FtsW
MLGLLAAGLLCSLAASPAAAARLGVEEPFAFLRRHAVYAALAAALIVGISMASPRTARRAAVLALLAGSLLLALTLAFGVEVNHARRWLRIAGFSLQPSEIVKPAFLVTAAWLLAEGRRTGARAAATTAAAVGFAVIAALLLAQPDFGQTALLAGAFAGLLFLAGAPWRLMIALAVAGVGLGAGGYAGLPHVAARVRAFLSPEVGYQTGLALEAIRRGGLFGVGPGEGLVKHRLPEAHTDFVFAVAAEELGLVFTLGLIGLLGLLVARLLAGARFRALETSGLAAGALALLIGAQSLINLAVNLNLAPAKGMTLPFVSYGGSSLVALGFAGGLALAFTRRAETHAAAAAAPARRRPAERSA